MRTPKQEPRVFAATERPKRKLRLSTFGKTSESSRAARSKSKCSKRLGTEPPFDRNTRKSWRRCKRALLGRQHQSRPMPPRAASRQVRVARLSAAAAAAAAVAALHRSASPFTVGDLSAHNIGEGLAAVGYREGAPAGAIGFSLRQNRSRTFGDPNGLPLASIGTSRWSRRHHLQQMGSGMYGGKRVASGDLGANRCLDLSPTASWG